MTAGAVGALIAPALAALGAIAALLTKCTLVVEEKNNIISIFTGKVY